MAREASAPEPSGESLQELNARIAEEAAAATTAEALNPPPAKS